MRGLFKPPARLRQVTSSTSPLGRALSAARDRQPSADEAGAVEARLFEALGTAAAVGALAGTTAAMTGAPVLAKGASVASAPASASGGVSGIAGSLALKVTLVLALGAGGASLGVRVFRHGRVASGRAAATPARRAATSPTAADLVGGPDPIPPSFPVAKMGPGTAGGAARDRPPAPRVIARAGAPGRLPVTVDRPNLRRERRMTADPVRAELLLIEHARAVLETDPEHAIELGQAHAREFPNGVMGEERDAIVISALLTLGRISEARALQASFDRAHPTSPYAAGLRDRGRAAGAP